MLRVSEISGCIGGYVVGNCGCAQHRTGQCSAVQCRALG